MPWIKALSRRFFPIAIALFACCVAGTPIAAAQQMWPDPAKTLLPRAPAKPVPFAPTTTQRFGQLPKPPPAPPDPAMERPIAFYLAHGETDTCGAGCSEWIAAEGKIDAGAIGRLQHVLAKLRKPLPPLFLHSPGGQVTGSIALGRLIRSRKLTVSVGHTIPLICDRDPLGTKSCEAQIGSGQTLEARIDPLSAVCASACVYMLAGGSTRLVPPWAVLGIHDVGIVPVAGRPAPTKLAMALGVATAYEQLGAYIREMGIDQRLLTEAFTIPFTSVELLSREDTVRFGLDRREFAETGWQYFDKPAPAMRKSFFVRTDDSRTRFVNGVASVFCPRGNDDHSPLSIMREHVNADGNDLAAQAPASVALNGQSIAVARAFSGKFYVRQGTVPKTVMDSVEDTATLVVPGAELGRQPGPSGDVTLNMLGFTQARAKLQDACLHPTATVTVQYGSIALASQSAPAAWQAKEPFVHGASRSQVDSTLGAPAQMVGMVALYTSPANPGKVMAGTFDVTGHLLHFARYVLKDGKVVDEIFQAELSDGDALPAIRSLLQSPVAASRLAAPAPAAASSR